MLASALSALACQGGVVAVPSLPQDPPKEGVLKDLEFYWKAFPLAKGFTFANRLSADVCLAARSVLETRPEVPGTNALHVSRMDRAWLVEVPIPTPIEGVYALSPSQTRLAVSGVDKNIKRHFSVIELSSATNLFDEISASTNPVQCVAWLNDDTVVYAQNAAETTKPLRYTLTSLDVKTKKKTVIYEATEKRAIWSIVPSPDERYLLMHEERTRYGSSPVLLDLQSSKSIELPHKGDSHSWVGHWAPDSSLAHYYCEESGHSFVDPKNPEKAKPAPKWLEECANPNCTLALSPDWKQCLATDVHERVLLLDSTGKSEVLIDFGRDSGALVDHVGWSPNSMHVAGFVARRVSQAGQSPTSAIIVLDTKTRQVTFFRGNKNRSRLLLLTNKEVIEQFVKKSRPGGWK